MNKIKFDKSLQKISDKEMEVLKLFLQGQSDPEISNRLHITEGTVRTHIYNVCKKFELNSSNLSHRGDLIDLFIRYQGAWVANCVRYLLGYPRWEDPVERTGSNFYLEQAKNCRDTNKAIELYENAVKGDRSDPYAQIYLNNAKARQAENPFRIGVVIAKAGNDFHEFASIQVLRGVAQSQTEFNVGGGKNEMDVC